MTNKTRDFFSLPNLLTILRIILTPPIIVFLFLGEGYRGKIYLFASIVLFTVAALTDFFDGYFARKYSAKTEHGSFLDPLADKVLVISTFLAFYFLDIISFWLIAVIVLRDLGITFLRTFMLKSGSSLNTSYFAKVKTTFQFVAIYLCFLYLIINSYLNIDYLKIYLDSFMFLVAIVTLWSGIDYLIKNKKFCERNCD